VHLANREYISNALGIFAVTDIKRCSCGSPEFDPGGRRIQYKINHFSKWNFKLTGSE